MENIHKYLLETGLTNLNDERDAVLEKFKQINLIIEDKSQSSREDLKNIYIVLRNLILCWIIEYNIKIDVDKGL